MKTSFSSLSDLASALGHTPPDEENKGNYQEPAKKNNESLVYSTDGGRIKQTKPTEVITASDGFARVKRETKGRKGKGVIIISGLALSSADLKKMASKLKKSCGAGGSVVGETIEIQGDKREKIKAALEKDGYKVKFTGG